MGEASDTLLAVSCQSYENRQLHRGHTVDDRTVLSEHALHPNRPPLEPSAEFCTSLASSHQLDHAPNSWREHLQHLLYGAVIVA